MKPFTTDDIVEIRNIDDEDFEFSVFGVDGYVIPSGQTERMPGYMATLAMRHMCDIVMQRRGLTQLMNNPLERDKIYQEIFVNVEQTIKPMPRNDAERARQEFENARNGNGPSENNPTISTAGVEDELASNLISTLENQDTSDETANSAFGTVNG